MGPFILLFVLIKTQLLLFCLPPVVSNDTQEKASSPPRKSNMEYVWV